MTLAFAPAIVPNALPPHIVDEWLAELSEVSRAQQWKIYKWLDRDMRCASHHHLLSQTLEAACEALAAALPPGVFESAWAETAGVEMWAQCRAAGSGLHFHWDVDEALGRESSVTACPVSQKMPGTLVLHF